MKKIITPLPNFQNYVNANDIQPCLDKIFASKRKSGNLNRTLYGCYKFIRPKASFSGLGDFVILAQCLEWMAVNNQRFTEKEIVNSLKYFEDYNPRTKRRNKEIAQYLLDLTCEATN